MTGLGVTKTLLEQHPTATVTVLEARTLCYGATGRIGGQMAVSWGSIIHPRTIPSLSDVDMDCNI